MDDPSTGSGQVKVDSSGFGNNGTTDDGANNTGMDCTKPGKYGTACKFDGTDDSINITIITIINLEHGKLLELLDEGKFTTATNWS